MPDEIVLIENGPLSEELYHVIEEKRRIFDRLIIYQFKENVQLGRALAKGVELCSYDLIARMDTDDIAVSNRFELQYNYMLEHKNIVAVGGYLQEFADEGGLLQIKEMPLESDKLLRYARYRNPLNPEYLVSMILCFIMTRQSTKMRKVVYQNLLRK